MLCYAAWGLDRLQICYNGKSLVNKLNIFFVIVKFF